MKIATIEYVLLSGFVIGSSMCTASDPVAIIKWGALAHVEANKHAKLQTFFTKKDEVYVPAARFITSRGIKRKIENFEIYDRLSPAILDDSPSVRYDGNGLYELYNGGDKQCWPFTCTGSHKTNEEVFVKRIHHTGLTEELLDMPECSIYLENDSVTIELYNGILGSGKSQRMFSMIPHIVQAVRNQCLSSKIFVIKMTQYAHEEPRKYKVMNYTNNAYIQWNSWIPCLMRIWAGRPVQLAGFKKPEDVIPVEEILIDQQKEDNYQGTYENNKKIAKLLSIGSVGSVLFIVCYLLKDTLSEISWE